MKSVYIVTGIDLTEAYVFAGNSSANSGLTNAACASVSHPLDKLHWRQLVTND